VFFFFLLLLQNNKLKESGGKEKRFVEDKTEKHTHTLSLSLVSSICLVFFALRKWGVQVLQL
jgi:F0F1-type ATP synthase membrane subunit a